MKRFISIILTIALLASIGMSVFAENEGTTTQVSESNTVTDEMVEAYADIVSAKTPDNTNIDPLFTLITENDNLKLYAITDNDNKRMGEIAIVDKATGYVWRSNPTDQQDDVIGKAAGHAYYRTKSQIALAYTFGYDYYDANTHYESILSDKVSCTVEEDSVKFVFRFRETEFAIPVRYSLSDDSFVAEILINDEEAKLGYRTMGAVAIGALGERLNRKLTLT